MNVLPQSPRRGPEERRGCCHKVSELVGILTPRGSFSGRCRQLDGHEPNLSVAMAVQRRPLNFEAGFGEEDLHLKHASLSKMPSMAL